MKVDILVYKMKVINPAVQNEDENRYVKKGQKIKINSNLKLRHTALLFWVEYK